MYQDHFNLTGLPFENVPDPRCFFDEGRHSIVLKRISSSLDSGRGLIVVTGPIGSGKTTLSHMVIAGQTDSTKLIWIAEPPDNSLDLFKYIAFELGVEGASDSKIFVMGGLRKALADLKASGKRCLLIVDESHLMSVELFNAIRLLNNLEEDASKLIQVLLLGQEEILEKIAIPELEPFRQRISALEHLGKLKPDEVLKYIAHRLQSVSGAPSLFSMSGWEAATKAFATGGTPRVINSLCDRSLRVAYETGSAQVGASEVYAASKEIGLDGQLYFFIAELVENEGKNTVPEQVDRAEPPSNVETQVHYSSQTQSSGSPLKSALERSRSDSISQLESVKAKLRELENQTENAEQASGPELAATNSIIDTPEETIADSPEWYRPADTGSGPNTPDATVAWSDNVVPEKFAPPLLSKTDSIKSYLNSEKITRLSDLESRNARRGKSLVGPLVLLCIAVAAFYYSFTGYCDKAGNLDYGRCVDVFIQEEVVNF